MLAVLLHMVIETRIIATINNRKDHSEFLRSLRNSLLHVRRSSPKLIQLAFLE